MNGTAEAVQVQLPFHRVPRHAHSPRSDSMADVRRKTEAGKPIRHCPGNRSEPLFDPRWKGSPRRSRGDETPRLILSVNTATASSGDETLNLLTHQTSIPLPPSTQCE
ncbi:hypothetical protein SKAU_G00197850 [Synaphobranchus kaupii]|uniref:Uncharacterized protein n=1 Tax=Synaphobranchus kaupii TaxID=118154 RepID=A0A9Q1FEY8_SYNKA|nr:hypothetical protein SKAU_G00197850 [Synaphobranchus kaupii]